MGFIGDLNKTLVRCSPLGILGNISVTSGPGSVTISNKQNQLGRSLDQFCDFTTNVQRNMFRGLIWSPVDHISSNNQGVTFNYKPRGLFGVAKDILSRILF